MFLNPMQAISMSFVRYKRHNVADFSTTYSKAAAFLYARLLTANVSHSWP